MATHDYVIDNSTGANVRADINNVLQAILTNNSSSSSPSTTAAYMFWADTTSGTLKIRNSSDNAWVELLQLDGTLTLEDGSASSPGLAFRDDLDTGIFSDASNALGIATAGVERIEFGTTECVVNDAGSNTDFRIEGDTEANLFFLDAGNDRIGIGTNSPSTLLHISDSQSSGGVGFTLHNSDSSAGTTPYCFISAILNPSRNGGEIRFGREGTYGDQNSADSFMAFYTSADDTNTERMRINSSGSVLVGTTSDSIFNDTSGGGFNIKAGGQLVLAKEATSAADPLVWLNDTGQTTNKAIVFAQDGSEKANIGLAGNDATITVAGSERMRINSSGNVGIGTSSPDQTLHVHKGSAGTIDSTANSVLTLENSTDAILQFLTPASNVNQIRFGDPSDNGAGYIDYNHNTNVLSFGTAGGGEDMRLDSAGRLGIGTTNPTAALEVSTSDAVVAEFTGTGGSGGYIGLFLGASGAAIGYIGRSGQLVGVGGTADNLAIRGENEIEFAINSSGTVTQRAKITTNGIETTSTIKVETAANLVNPLTIDDSINNNFNTNAAVFRKGSTGEVGSISCNRSGTTYNTTSDYRLKENVVSISDGITRLKTLKPYRFNFISDSSSTVDGFFAHEVTAVPEAVKGTKDEVATEDIDGKNIKKGDPIYQQIDHSKLVPLLVAAVQELITKVETLEAA